MTRYQKIYVAVVVVSNMMTKPKIIITTIDRDVSGFVGLLYILSKNKIYCILLKNNAIFLANNFVIFINY